MTKVVWLNETSLRFSEMPLSPLEPQIQFHFLKKGFTLKNRPLLKKFLSWLFKQECKTLNSLNYVFCSDAYLFELNKKELKHNYYTDILTFPLMDPGQPIMADIYISIDRIRENAREYASSIEKEVHRVIFHGALHLCDYKDRTRAEKIKMRNLEDKYLNRYFQRPS